MNRVRLIAFFLFLFNAYPSAAHEGLLGMSLEDLLSIRITSTSFFEETPLSTTYSVNHLDQKDWEKMGASNLGEVLNHLPSTISPLGFGQSRTVAVRGYFPYGSVRTTAVNFDGVQMTRLRQGSGTMNLDGIDLSVLESLELIRGPGSSLHGSNAFQGVLSLNSKKLENQGLGFKVGGGSLGQSELSMSAHTENGVHSLTGIVAYRDTGDADQDYTFNDYNTGEIGYGNRSNQRENTTALIKYGVALSPDVSLQTTLLQTKFDAEQLPGLGELSSLGNQNDKDWTFYSDDSYLAKTRLDYKLSDSRSLEVSLYHWGFEDHYWADLLQTSPQGIILDEFRKESHSGLQFRHRFAKSEQHRLTVAYEYQIDKLEDFSISVQPAPGVYYYDKVPQSDTGYERTLHSVVVDGRTNVKNVGLELTYGLRVDDYDEFATQFSPRIGLQKDLRSDGDQSLNLTYGEAFRAPALFELYGSARVRENFDLDPETLKSLELKYLLKQTHWFHAITLFGNRWNDGIQTKTQETDAGEVFAQFSNTGKNESAGLEYEGKFRWLNFEMDVSTSYIRSRNLEANEDFEAFPYWISDVNLGYAYQKIGIYSNNRYMKRTFVSVDIESESIEYYFVSDLVFRWLIEEKLRFDLTVKNILGRSDSTPSALPHLDGLIDEGRNLRGSLKWTF